MVNKAGNSCSPVRGSFFVAAILWPVRVEFWLWLLLRWLFRSIPGSWMCV